jgi:hypothetical protein
MRTIIALLCLSSLTLLAQGQTNRPIGNVTAGAAAAGDFVLGASAAGVAKRIPLSFSPGNTFTVGSAGAGYTTIGAAKAAATPGSTILVYPGTYTENNLLAAGVNYFFWPGARVVWQCVTNTVADGYGIFDDRATGATTNWIYGAMDFYYSFGTNVISGVTGNTNAAGGLVLTNPASNLIFNFRQADGDAFPETAQALVNGFSGSPSLFYISRCRRCELYGNEMQSSRRYAVVGNANALTGLYWELGETHATIEHVSPFLGYGFWPNEPAGGPYSDNLYVKGGLVEGYIYQTTAEANGNYRTWWNLQELRVTNSLATPGSAIAIQGGKAYVTAEKISSLDASGTCVSVGSSQGGEVWVTAQKLTSPNNGRWVNNAGAAITHITAQQYESTTTNNIGFRTTSTSTLLEIDGGEATLNGIGISHEGGACVVKNLRLATTNGNYTANWPIQVLASGLVVQGCRLIAPALCTNSIYASSAQTVGVLWTAGNTTNNPVVTLSPLGLFSYDVNLK